MCEVHASMSYEDTDITKDLQLRAVFFEIPVRVGENGI